MNKLQIVVVSSSVILFLVLLLGGRTKPLERGQIDKSRAMAAEHVSIDALVMESKAVLGEADQKQLSELESSLTLFTTDSSRSNVLKEISGKWYALRHYTLSGHYAEQVAEIDKTDEAWSIAGINYNLGFQQAQEEKISKYCFEKATKAFEKAITINPDEQTHKINLYLCYINNSERTMEGVMGLRSMLEKEPDNVDILLTLGKLSVTKTQEFEKAINRLTKAIEIEPDNLDVNYYLAQAYQGANQIEKAKEHFKKCLALSNNEAFKTNIRNIIGEE